MVSSPTNRKSLKSLKPKKIQDYSYNNESLSDDKISPVIGEKKKKTIRAQNAPANRKVNKKLSANNKISPMEKKESKKRKAITKVLTQDDSASKKVNKKLSNENKIFNFETNQTDIDLRKENNENEEINKSLDLSKTPTKNNTLGNLKNIEDIKTENIHLLETPKKIDVSRDLESTNIKIEDAETPIKSIVNLGIDSVEWHAQTEISSTSKKKKRHLYDESTPKKKIKKDLSSDINDYDQLSDIPKKELCDNELNDFEHIEMLHDPNSLIDFEESTIFCSTNEVVPDDENIEISRDSKSDPLYIIDNNNTSIAENMENEGKNAGNKIERKRKHESSNTDTDSDVDYDTIKHVLGELELDIPLEDEEDELTEEATKVNICINILFFT